MTTQSDDPPAGRTPPPKKAFVKKSWPRKSWDRKPASGGGDRFRPGPPSRGSRRALRLAPGGAGAGQRRAGSLHRLLATENAMVRLTEEIGTLRIDARAGAAERHQRAARAGRRAPGPLPRGRSRCPGPDLDDLPDDALLLALDQITDPHNVGAIVRTAAAFGVAGIITTARHSPNATGVLAKSASGGLEHVPLVVVRNLVGGADRSRASAASPGSASIPRPETALDTHRAEAAGGDRARRRGQGPAPAHPRQSATCWPASRSAARSAASTSRTPRPSPSTPSARARRPDGGRLSARTA